MKIKKILSVIICFVLFVNVFSVTAFAASPKVGSSFSYKNGYTSVTLSCKGYTLYYTTDGSKPDRSDKKYTGKIKLTKPSMLRVSVYDGNKRVGGAKASVGVRVKAPTAEVIGYDGEFTVYRVTAPSGSTVYYTGDGSTPTKSNGLSIKRESFELRVAEGATVKLRAYKDGWMKSKVRSAFGDDVSGDEYTADDYEPETYSGSGEYAAEVLRLVNKERTDRGLSELKADDKLAEAAAVRANELIKKYDHTRPDGSICFTALSEAGISSYYYAAENIAAGQRTPAEVVNSWMNSTGHRKNILNGNYKYIGIGHVKGGAYGNYWAQLFIG